MHEEFDMPTLMPTESSKQRPNNICLESSMFDLHIRRPQHPIDNSIALAEGRMLCGGGRCLAENGPSCQPSPSLLCKDIFDYCHSNIRCELNKLLLQFSQRRVFDCMPEPGEFKCYGVIGDGEGANANILDATKHSARSLKPRPFNQTLLCSICNQQQINNHTQSQYDNIGIDNEINHSLLVVTTLDYCNAMCRIAKLYNNLIYCHPIASSNIDKCCGIITANYPFLFSSNALLIDKS